MSLNIALALIAGLGPGQGPSMDTQIVTPIGSQVGVSAPQSQGSQSTNTATGTVGGYYIQAPAASSSQKITVSFRDVKASEILAWLEKHGVNFVVSSDDVPDKKFTINVEDQPIDDVLDVMASTLGGHWEQDHGIRVFHKGLSQFGVARLGVGSPYTVFTTPSAPAVPPMPPLMKMPPMPPMHAMPIFPKKADGKPMTSEEMQKYIGSKEFQDKMEAWGKQFEQKFDNKEFQQRMEQWSKDVQKNFGPDFQKKMQDFAKENAQQYKSFTYTSPDAMKLNVEAQKMRVQADAARAQADAARISSERFRILSRGTSRTTTSTTTTMSFDGLDVQKFIKDLTAEQKDKQRKRGYILFSDLTPEQKKAIGGKPEGNFTITFKVNGDEVTIKNG